MLKQRIDLWAGREAFRQKVEVVQEDAARVLEATLQDAEIPEGAELRFYARKPSGKKIYNVATGEGRTVTITLSKQTLAEPGVLPCQLEIVDTDGKHLTTFRFDIDVVASLNPDASVESMEETDVLRKYTQAAEQAKQDAEAAQGKAEEAQNNAEDAQHKAEAAKDEATTQAGLAAGSATEAKAAQSAAEDAQRAAESARDTAKGHADAAAKSETAAAASAKEAENWSNMSKSWAVGDAGGARDGEDTDNSKYYAGLAKSSQDAAAQSVKDAVAEVEKAKAQAGAAAQSAKDAEAAKGGADAAQTAAEQARDEATRQAGLASDSAAAAAGSVTAAKAQADAAAGSATEAAGHAADAEAAQSGAEAAKGLADAAAKAAGEAQSAAEKARDEAANIVGGDFATNEALNTHISDTTVHVTEEERTAWNAKADEADITAAVEAHNKATDAHADIRDTLSKHTADTTVHITAAERTAWNAKIDASALTPYQLKASLNADAVSSDVKTRYGGVAGLNEALTNNAQELTAKITAAGWSAAKDANGWFTQTVTVSGMKAAYNPVASLAVTSAALAEAEREAFGKIYEIETADGSIIAKALEKPTTDVTVRLAGV